MEGIQRVFPGARINGHPKFRALGCLSIRFPGHQSDALIDAWEGIEVAKGSACDATTTQSSHVLRSMRLTRAQADSSIRLSLGRFTTEIDVENALTIIGRSVDQPRSI